MKKLTAIGFALIAWSAVSLGAVIPATGHWEGKIQIPEHELAISVDLAPGANGAWIGSMSVVGTTALDVPLEKVTVDDTAIRFTARLPEPASFEGKLSADAAAFSGQASNAEGEAPFELARKGEANVKVPPPGSALPKEFEGLWEGVLNAPEKAVKVGLRLSRGPDGTATAVLIDSTEGNLEIPVNVVTVTDKELRLEARAVSGTYHGTLGAGGEVAGEWAQGPARLPLTFRRATEPANRF